VLYLVILLLASLGLFATHAMGALYLAVALATGGGLLALGVRLARTQSLKHANALFWFSNYYLAILFAAMVVDRVWR
jgi:protoheme IX farnesyltransferase